MTGRQGGKEIISSSGSVLSPHASGLWGVHDRLVHHCWLAALWGEFLVSGSIGGLAAQGAADLSDCGKRQPLGAVLGEMQKEQCQSKLDCYRYQHNHNGDSHTPKDKYLGMNVR